MNVKGGMQLKGIKIGKNRQFYVYQNYIKYITTIKNSRRKYSDVYDRTLF